MQTSPTARPAQSSPTAAMPVISRNAPAFAVNGVYSAANGDDEDYATEFRGKIPTSLVYDLSNVAPARRGRVVVAWYNEDTIWDASAISSRSYNEPRDYAISANRETPGGQPPSDGWTTLLRVSGNRFNSRLHAVDLTGFSWLRISVSAVNGSPGNDDAAFNLDVHDARETVGDGWWFFGDSITQDDMSHRGGPTFAQQVSAAVPSRYPAQQDGGIGGWDSAAPLQINPATHQPHISEYLSLSPGRYVSVAFGTNDANQNIAPQIFYSNMAKIVDAVLAAGKVPVVPLIPWGCTAGIATDGPKLNSAIRDLWAAYPQIIHGPDFWSYFAANQGLMSRDCIHPTLPEGAVAYRRTYARAMLRAVYGVSESP
ncbi:MAG: SGNH/GDSL hydrolase family protein [Candidatus Dormibacteraeota bacterium]|nr:SGNH/GDSL hydrolase family protein [Candidatus Dormibacteraeota bacterium]